MESTWSLCYVGEQFSFLKIPVTLIGSGAAMIIIMNLGLSTLTATELLLNDWRIKSKAKGIHVLRNNATPFMNVMY